MTRKLSITGLDSGGFVVKLSEFDDNNKHVKDELFSVDDINIDQGKIIGTVPPMGLLISMAIRNDHALAIPGYYDQEFLKSSTTSHQKIFRNTILEMEKLYEEVCGNGFYNIERDAEYMALFDQTNNNASNDDVLNALIQRARNHQMTPEEIEAQRQSFVRAMQPCEHGVADYETCEKCRSKLK